MNLDKVPQPGMPPGPPSRGGPPPLIVVKGSGPTPPAGTPRPKLPLAMIAPVLKRLEPHRSSKARWFRALIVASILSAVLLIVAIALAPFATEEVVEVVMPKQM